jgi:hypothetical protein
MPLRSPMHSIISVDQVCNDLRQARCQRSVLFNLSKKKRDWIAVDVHGRHAVIIFHRCNDLHDSRALSAFVLSILQKNDLNIDAPINNTIFRGDISKIAMNYIPQLREQAQDHRVDGRHTENPTYHVTVETLTSTLPKC